MLIEHNLSFFLNTTKFHSESDSENAKMASMRDCKVFLDIEPNLFQKRTSIAILRLNIELF